MSRTEMQLYNESPSKKVGQQDNYNEGRWVEDPNGVMHKINSSAAKMETERKVRSIEKFEIKRGYFPRFPSKTKQN